MKIKIDKAPLLHAVEHAAKAARAKDGLPFANVLVESWPDGQITFTGAGILGGVCVTLADAVDEPGAIAVNARELLKAVKSLPAGDVKLTATDKGTVISSGRARFRLPYAPGEDYPVVPFARTGTELVEFDGEAMAKLIGYVLHAASDDETRPHLAGVKLTTEDGKLIAAATDGHRLVKAVRPWDGPAIDALVHKHSIPQVLDLLGAPSVAIATSTGTNGGQQLHLRAGHLECTTKLVSEQFPPIAKVIPADHRPTNIDRARLIEGVKRVCQVETNAVKFAFGQTEGVVDLIVETPDGDAFDAVDCDWDREPMAVGISGKYLLDLLAVIPDDVVGLSVLGQLDPVQVRATVDTTEVTAVVMPMRI